MPSAWRPSQHDVDRDAEVLDAASLAGDRDPHGDGQRQRETA